LITTPGERTTPDKCEAPAAVTLAVTVIGEDVLVACVPSPL
jgi:hypothetical protein